MAEAATEGTDSPKKRGKLPLILAAALALVLGGAGFYATWSGLLLGGHEPAEEAAAPLPDIAFVPIEPVVISLPETARNAHLRFTAQLEVAGKHTADVTLLLPRIVDILNGYLRAIDVAEIEDPTALVRIRAQLLRRIQLVSGEGRVRDLLITEFVLN
jgi:flagellar protein FliL